MHHSEHDKWSALKKGCSNTCCPVDVGPRSRGFSTEIQQGSFCPFPPHNKPTAVVVYILNNEKSECFSMGTGPQTCDLYMFIYIYIYIAIQYTSIYIYILLNRILSYYYYYMSIEKYIHCPHGALLPFLASNHMLVDVFMAQAGVCPELAGAAMTISMPGACRGSNHPVISTGDSCCPPVATAGSSSPWPVPARATTSSTSFIWQKGSEVTERRNGRRRKETGNSTMTTGTADDRFLLALIPPWALPAMENQGAPP